MGNVARNRTLTSEEVQGLQRPRLELRGDRPGRAMELPGSRRRDRANLVRGTSVPRYEEDRYTLSDLTCAQLPLYSEQDRMERT